MLQSLHISQLRSYFDPQTLTFSAPDGTRGSGYNVLVGKNNSGKSTLLKLIRDLTSSEQRMTVGQEARHDPDRPVASIKWREIDESGKATITPITIDASGSGGLFQKSGQTAIRQESLRYIPARRPFMSEFNAAASFTPSSYEHSDFINRRGQQAYFDSNLANLIASLPLNSDNGARFVAMLRRIDPRISTIDADNVGGRDVIRFQSASGRWHPISDTGDGLINTIRIGYALSTSVANDCVIIDEPELSLHPQLQRNLYELLIEHSASKQILVVTHSPHFLAWNDICRAGRLIRLFLDSNGASRIRTASVELGIKCAALYDGDKRDIFESQLALRPHQHEEIGIFLLGRDDIRDKYKRNEQGRETDTIDAAGVFQRNGRIRASEKARFDILIESIRSFLS